MSDEDVVTDYPPSLEGLTARERRALYWGLTWRAALATVASLTVSKLVVLLTVVAIGIGSRAGSSGTSFQRLVVRLQALHDVIELPVMCAFFIVWFKWMLRVDFGPLNLVVVRNLDTRRGDATLRRAAAIPSGTSHGTHTACVPWLFLFGGLILAAWRCVHALHWLFEWKRERMADPSPAELSEVLMWFNGALVALGLALALVSVVVIRRRRQASRRAV